MWIGPNEIALIHNLAPELWAAKVTWGAILKLAVIIVQFIMSANSRMRYGLRSYSFVCTLHHLIVLIVPTYL